MTVVGYCRLSGVCGGNAQPYFSSVALDEWSALVKSHQWNYL